jgi:hypothetical protein
MAACTFVPHVNFCELQLLAVNKREVCSGRALLKLCTYCMPGLGLAKAWKAQSLCNAHPLRRKRAWARCSLARCLVAHSCLVGQNGELLCQN